MDDRGKPGKVDRIACPAREVFEREYLYRGRPVIVRGALDHCKAASWTPEYLVSVLGNKSVSVAISSDGSFKFTPEAAAFDRRDMALAAAIELMRTVSGKGTRYYVMQRSIAAEFPELVGDVAIPELFAPGDLLATNLWLGSGGNVTPLHFDGSNNLLSQIDGRKAVTIFAPDQTRYLYPMQDWARYSHVSELDLECVDHARFPLFGEASPIELILDPGDTLFLPGFWWHHVRSLELSISINFWWRSPPSQFFAPNSVRLLPAMFSRNRLAGLGVTGGLIALARYARDEAKLQWVAVLCAAGAFDQHVRGLLREHGVNGDSIPGRLGAVYASLAKVAGGRLVTLDAGALDRWTQLVSAARAADDRQLPRAEVADMVAGIDRFIASWARG